MEHDYKKEDIEIGETLNLNSKDETEDARSINFIERFEHEIDTKKYENTLCFRISKKKFHCLMLILVLILTLLQIVKMSIPSMEEDDVKELSSVIMKSFRKFANALKKSNKTILINFPSSTSSPISITTIPEYES
jgi:hypothetical protein